MVTKARIQDGVVAEILTADPFPPFNEALIWVECPLDTVEGDLYDGETFSHYVPPPPTTEQLVAAAIAEKARLTGICNYQISVLTNAVDPDVVDNPDPADAALLILWKKYQQALRKVVTTVVPVTWPAMPNLASGTNSMTPPTA